MRNFDVLYRAGSVERFHTVRTHHRQTIADHSWGVLMIILAVCEPSPKLVLAALAHDLAESVTGDVPATAKWMSPSLGRELESLEQRFNLEHDIFPDLTPLELRILKWADMAELVMYCEQEIRMGNQSIAPIWLRGLDYLKQNGAPCDQAESFFNRYLETLGQR